MKTPTLGSTVSCPADRGGPGYTGRVMDVGTSTYRNCRGAPFVWVAVQHPFGHKVIWPSNRLDLCN